VQIVKTAVTREEGRRQGLTEQIDPATLSMSAQQKYDAALRAALRKLEADYNTRITQEVRKRIEASLTLYAKEREEFRHVIKARKGVMDRSTYKKILSCLHPDRMQDPSLKTQFADAFHLFSQLEVVLLDETQHETNFPPIPRTHEELMAAKAKVAAKRRARRKRLSLRGNEIRAEGRPRPAFDNANSAIPIVRTGNKRRTIPMTQQYGVWCEVWGGVTGYRAKWLKSSGTLQVFDSALAATAVADCLSGPFRSSKPFSVRGLWSDQGKCSRENGS
jgi:hypothetical protein